MTQIEQIQPRVSVGGGGGGGGCGSSDFWLSSAFFFGAGDFASISDSDDVEVVVVVAGGSEEDVVVLGSGSDRGFERVSFGIAGVVLPIVSVTTGALELAIPCVSVRG
jgi:hypothetical protein